MSNEQCNKLNGLRSTQCMVLLKLQVLCAYNPSACMCAGREEGEAGSRHRAGLAAAGCGHCTGQPARVLSRQRQAGVGGHGRE